MVVICTNKASQNRQQAGWTRKLAFAGRRYASKVNIGVFCKCQMKRK